MLKVTLSTITALLLTAGAASAMQAPQEGCGSMQCSSCHSLSVQEADKLLSYAGIKVKSVKPAVSQGLFEVLFEQKDGLGIVFVDYGKKNLLQGTVIDLETKQPVFAHEKDIPKPKHFTGVDPALIPVQHAFVIGNPKAKKQIYVFTDPDCPYCRTLHAELNKLEKIMPDLSINIFLFPLQSIHPKAYDKSRVIIAGKKRELLDKAFEGKELPGPKGDEGKASIDAIIAFSNQEGISGTPLIVMPDGKPYQGQRTAEALKAAVEGNSK